MKFYHGASAERFKETVTQGFLLHKRATKDFPNMDPCTYLAVDIEEARQYGLIVLEVEYDPMANPEKNNYQEGCWQVRVYEPIYKWKVVENEKSTKRNTK